MKLTVPFLAPVLTCVVLANIPVRPPLKVALGFCLVIGVSAFLGLLLSYAFRGAPHILFGVSALIVFLALYALAKGASKLAPLFILVCVTVVPVIGLQSLVAAEGFAVAFASGACFAMFVAWVSWLFFPKALPPRAAPKAVPPPPALALRIALLGTAILAPLMLAYLMLGLYTAIPAMVGTVLIVASLDFQLGRKQAFLNVVANFAGGVSSVIVLVLLAIHPTLATFTLLLAGLCAAVRLENFSRRSNGSTAGRGLQRLPDRIRQQPAFGFGNVLGVADARRPTSSLPACSRLE